VKQRIIGGSGELAPPPRLLATPVAQSNKLSYAFVPLSRDLVACRQSVSSGGWPQQVICTAGANSTC
jgi:hypothetical protein